LENFQIALDATIIRKGIHSDIESYSAFWDYAKTIETPLNRYLKARNITDVYVCGIATDVCIGTYIKGRIQVNVVVAKYSSHENNFSSPKYIFLMH
jgi:nicotinamidase-related amidase